MKLKLFNRTHYQIEIKTALQPVSTTQMVTNTANREEVSLSFALSKQTSMSLELSLFLFMLGLRCKTSPNGCTQKLEPPERYETKAPGGPKRTKNCLAQRLDQNVVTSCQTVCEAHANKQLKIYSIGEHIAPLSKITHSWKIFLSYMKIACLYEDS